MKILKKWKKIHLRSVRSVFTFKWEKLAYLIGADMSPSSHHSLGGLMYMHHSSQL